MKALKKPMLTIDDYIKVQEKDKQVRLQELRAIIKKAAPKATEGIGYQMPVFIQNGHLVYFAAFKNHYGFYPTSKPIEVFREILDEKGYTYSKGAIQFPLDQAFPVKLIQDMVKFRIKENEIKALTKQSNK